ncbi:MAG: hypothetical protein Q7S14_00105, partial [bacterium]|nr:hypothetical protein [bacterium]
LRGQSVIQTDPTFAPNTPQLAQNFEATSSAEVKINGAADAKTIVELFQNTNSQGTTISSDDGSFTFDVNLLNGENNFTTQAISSAGKKSDLSSAYKIYYLNKPPKLDFEVKDNTIISGTTDPGVNITVNDHFVLVDPLGNFKYSPYLSSGDNKILILATDKAGNVTKKEVQIKSTATP